MFRSFWVADCVHVGKLLLAALGPSDISLIDFMDIKETVSDHSYALAAVIVACKTTKSVNWASVSFFSIA